MILPLVLVALAVGLLLGLMLAHRGLTGAAVLHRSRAARQLEAMHEDLRSEHTVHLALFHGHTTLADRGEAMRLEEKLRHREPSSPA